MQTTQFLSRDEIRDYYADQMSWDEHNVYKQFGDLSIARVFHGKLFVVYNLIRRGDSPNILAVLRVTGINIIENNLAVDILDLRTGVTCRMEYMPKLLCGYDIFGSVPSECIVSKVLKQNEQGHVIDVGLSAGILLRHRMKPEFQNPGYIYCVGMTDFGRLFGDAGRKAFEKLETVHNEEAR